MITVKGIYEAGVVKLLEPIPFRRKANVIVTVMDEFDEEKEVKTNLFKDLAGVISNRSDGSTDHDKYIYQREHL